ncbi:hypothetical protein K440DRAFT_558303 [Wilcoxina mikolae CBS 423.85]|nr:hypothetical protein K440DRAFT_558303 [Wilcoxina mikolae CBS 423.85]
MSVPFGFSLGDFIAVGQLAWTLYRQCYLVARGAPQEFQHLLGEITMLCQSIQFLQEEVNNPNSTLVRAGDDRVALVNQVMSRVEETLKELQKCANKYEKLGDVKQPKVKQMWRRVKWSVDAADLDALRNKVRVLSSLERIENATHKIERRLSDIKTFIQKAESHGVETQTPRITNSMTGDELFDLKLSTTLMKNAEVSGRWASIGIDQWIQAGRWWLLRAQMDIHTPNSPNHMMPQRGYANLIKASWILIDIISRHPQLNFLYSDVQLEVELLAGMIREEFRIIERLGLQIPNLKNLSENDMQIWELEVKGDTLQPGDAPDNTGASRPWVIADEHIIFQQYVLNIFLQVRTSTFGSYLSPSYLAARTIQPKVANKQEF